MCVRGVLLISLCQGDLIVDGPDRPFNSSLSRKMCRNREYFQVLTRFAEIHITKHSTSPLSAVILCVWQA